MIPLEIPIDIPAASLPIFGNQFGFWRIKSTVILVTILSKLLTVAKNVCPYPYKIPKTTEFNARAGIEIQSY